jgi:hypothetical protein
MRLRQARPRPMFQRRRDVLGRVRRRARAGKAGVDTGDGPLERSLRRRSRPRDRPRRADGSRFSRWRAPIPFHRHRVRPRDLREPLPLRVRGYGDVPIGVTTSLSRSKRSRGGPALGTRVRARPRNRQVFLGFPAKALPCAFGGGSALASYEGARAWRTQTLSSWRLSQ